MMGIAAMNVGSISKSTAFQYVALPMRVVFGVGTIERVADEAKELGIHRPLILTTPEQKAHGNDIARILSAGIAGIFSRATMHTPTEITEEALRVYVEQKADGLIAIGGG